MLALIVGTAVALGIARFDTWWRDRRLRYTQR